MYDIIREIIGHEWVQNYNGDQQYIYYICGALIILFTICFIDWVYRFIFWISHRK